MAISEMFLNSIRLDAELLRLPDLCNIYDLVNVDDGHGTMTSAYTLRTGGPFPANFQIQQRYPFVDNIAHKPVTSTEYVIRIPVSVTISKTSRIQHYTGGVAGIMFEITEETVEHSDRFVTLLHCKKVT